MQLHFIILLSVIGCGYGQLMQMVAQGMVGKALQFAKDLVANNGKAGGDLKVIKNTLTTGDINYIIQICDKVVNADAGTVETALETGTSMAKEISSMESKQGSSGTLALKEPPALIQGTEQALSQISSQFSLLVKLALTLVKEVLNDIQKVKLVGSHDTHIDIQVSLVQQIESNIQRMSSLLTPLSTYLTTLENDLHSIKKGAKGVLPSSANTAFSTVESQLEDLGNDLSTVSAQVTVIIQDLPTNSASSGTETIALITMAKDLIGPAVKCAIALIDMGVTADKLNTNLKTIKADFKDIH